MIITTGGNDFFKYPYAAIWTGSEKLGARFKVSGILFWVGELAEEQQLAKHLVIIRKRGLWAGDCMKYFSMTGQDKETWGLGRAALPKAQCFSSTTAGYRELPCHKVTTAMRRGGGLYSEGKLVCIPTTPRSHISPRRACPQRLWWPNKGLFPSLPFQVSSGCSANKPQLKPLISSS